MNVVDHTAQAAQADVQLARRLLAGDQEAFEHFVTAYNDKVFRYSFAMCGQREDAEEVAQETLMKVFENLDQLREPERLKPWVFRIAKNACLMKRRKSVFAPRAELSLDQLRPAKRGDGDGAKLEIADWSGLPDNLAMDAELRERLADSVQALPEMYRSVFLLRDVEGLSTEEAAEVLGVSGDVIKQRLHRGRLILRKDLDDYLRIAQGTAKRQ
jgi:RNA polymerase sigma-70 factor (ECF subfamily)